MNTLRFVVVAGCLIFGLAVNAADKVNGVINFQGDTVHMELMGRQNWDYDVKRLERQGKTVVQMTVPSVDESTVKSFSTFKSDFVSKVEVDTNGPDGKSVISFTLSGENIDTFDYLTDQPSRLIMDFYVNPNSKAKPAPVAAKKDETIPTELPAKVVKTDVKAKTAKGRKPATADALTVAPQGVAVAANTLPSHGGIFDGGDPQYERFALKPYEIKEDAIIKAKSNYYIPFPMLETPVSQWEKIKISPTLYEISPKDSEENKQARLLLTLFEKKRFAVYLKTRDWFAEKYPKSEYNELIDFMTADVHLSLWQEEGRANEYEEAMQLYKEAIEKHPKSPLAERTSLKLGYLALEKGDFLNCLRYFNEHNANKSYGALSKDLARLGSGLAFMKLNKWNEAIEKFDEVEKTSSNRDLKVEAAYRRGDVWTKAKNYAKAVDEYQQALKKYPEGQNYYPNAFFNQAESLFGQQKYTQSIDVFRDFIKRFPSNNHSPLAMTRLGELLEILGADKSRVMGAYLETYFRYGENPNAVIARLRLLSARMKGMKPKEVQNAVEEIMSLAKKMDLPNAEQFATVMVADGYSSRDEFQNSVDLLSKYYKEHPSTVDVNLITRRIVSNINDKIQTEIDNKNFIAALKTHKQYADSWLKNSKRLDTKFNLGRAFEMAGVPTEAEKYYKDVLNRLYAIRGTDEAREVQVTEQTPSEDELNLRLSGILAQEGKFSQSYEYLKAIKSPEKLPETDQIERVEIAVRLLEKRGDTESAIRYLGELLKTWKGQPELVAEPYLRLAELQEKQGKSDESLQALKMVDQLSQDSGKVAPVTHAKALEMMGDIYLKQNKTDLAMSSYQNLLEKYEEKRPLSSIRYKLGQLYFKKGEIQKAADIWNEFKGPKSEFWKNLAHEQLQNSEWRDGYKKYIKRIPAMSENETGK
ncbi:tetratricopeptide repeat protein [Bdellovibrio sp. HCB2-146]|uniref:tetratricopeptide repeat protein n=1 Tax=Bdellovibrio sp. HCB2-146 TaxID=3394362 RepID=UPI0039BCE0DF